MKSRYKLRVYDSSETFIKEYPIHCIAQGVELGYKNGFSYFHIIEGEDRKPKLYWNGAASDLAWYKMSIFDAIKLALEKDNQDSCND